MEQITGGFSFAEGPRWHDGAVYLSHIHDDAIERVDLDGTVSRVAELPGSPISLGFASDGSMLVSALSAGRIWRVVDGEVSDFRDVTALAEDDFGDIVIDRDDRIYLANQGMHYPTRIPETIDSPIFLLTPDGAAREVARGFNYANGLAITPDGTTLIVAESFGHRLFGVDINDDGSLGARRLIVQFDDNARPDGICCDAAGECGRPTRTSREVVRCTSTALSRTECRRAMRWQSDASSEVPTDTICLSRPRRPPYVTRRERRVRGALRHTCGRACRR